MSSRANRKIKRKIERALAKSSSPEIFREMERQHPKAFKSTESGKAWQVAKKMMGEDAHWHAFDPAWTAPKDGEYSLSGGTSEYVRKGDTLEVKGEWKTIGLPPFGTD